MKLRMKLSVRLSRSAFMVLPNQPSLYFYAKNFPRNLLNTVFCCFIGLFRHHAHIRCYTHLERIFKDFIFHVCEICQRKELIEFTEQDRVYAKKDGGLFVKILDHGTHMISLKVDGNGDVRRSHYIDYD